MGTGLSGFRVRSDPSSGYRLAFTFLHSAAEVTRLGPIGQPTRMNKPKQVEWFDEPEEHNYPAARSYLSLLYPEADADRLVERLRSAKMVSFRAKDISRASGLSLLGVSNSHVSKNDDKIQNGVSLSPLLLVRSRIRDSVIVADGYHRLCAVYRHNEDAWIPCKIA